MKHVAFADAVKSFLEFVDARVRTGIIRPTTGLSFHNAFRRITAPDLLNMKMHEIRAVDIENWYIDVVGSNAMRAPTAIARLKFVRALFDFAIRREWAAENPVTSAMKAIGKPPQKRITTFSVEEASRLIAFSNKKCFRSRAMVYERTRLAVNLAAYCGLRWGEIFGLTVDNICTDGNTINICHTLDRFGNLNEPKTKAGNRLVPLPDHIATLLRNYVNLWPNPHPQRLVFTSTKCQPLSSASFRTYEWQPLLRRAGLFGRANGPLHFHALRHFAVSWMIDNGWPITDVSAIVGHNHYTTTLAVYAHVVKGRVQMSAAMQQLAERLIDLQAGAATNAIRVEIG